MALDGPIRPREVVGLSFGQFGIQAGMVMWDVLCKKYGFAGAHDGIFDGVVGFGNDGVNDKMMHIHSKFLEHSNGYFRPRAVFLDLDEEPINKIQNGYLKNLFDCDNSFGCLNSSACNNYARGCYGREAKELLSIGGERLRYAIEETDHLYAIYHINALEGGTGSGYATAFVSRFLDSSGKYHVFSHQLLPSETISNSTNSLYNAILGYANIGASGANFNTCYNNEALYQRCYRGLVSPTYKDLNGLIAPMIAESISNDIWCQLTNSVPFPALNWLIPALNPCLPKDTDSYITPTSRTVTMNIVKPMSALFSYPILNGKLLTSLLIYCSEDNDTQNHIPALHHLRKTNSEIFVSWSPTFKVLNNCKSFFPDTSAFMDNDVTLIGFFNSTTFRHALKKMGTDFDLLSAFESFMHWYTELGMEREQFKEARSHLQQVYDAYKITELSAE